VLVEENQSVVAGQPLFRLDPVPFRMALTKAEAKLAQVRVDLAATQASFREKQAEIALARTKYAFAQKDQRRQADLVAQHFVSALNFDNARQSTDLARAANRRLGAGSEAHRGNLGRWRRCSG
jgi:membrane fusion protein (multidrug efflux system)